MIISSLSFSPIDILEFLFNLFVLENNIKSHLIKIKVSKGLINIILYFTYFICDLSFFWVPQELIPYKTWQTTNSLIYIYHQKLILITFAMLHVETKYSKLDNLHISLHHKNSLLTIYSYHFHWPACQTDVCV